MDGGVDRDLVDQVGLPPTTVLGPDLGSAGRTRVHLAADRGVLKVFLGRSGRKPARERAALEALAGGTPTVPRLVDHGELADGSPWVLMSLLAGRPMGRLPEARRASDRERIDWARWAGRSAGELHQTIVPAFGPWTADPAEDPVHYYRERSAALLEEARAVGRLGAGLLDRIAAAQHELEPSLGTIGPPVLVHRDLNAHNLLGFRRPDGSWVRTGVIDFESSGGGDPLEDLRWLALTQPRGPVEAAFIGGYLDAGAALPSDAARIRYHQLDLVLDIGTWQAMEDRSMIERAQVAADRLLR
jgi:aminoglycoside phosphotransferase (APT) family kinase protein